MRLGIADHLGWAVAVTSSADNTVVDRRRIELVEAGLTAAPIHYESHRLDVAATAALVEKVRASVVRATSAALDDLASALPEPIVSISLRVLPSDFPEDIAVQRRSPYEARADAIMYRQVLVDVARARGWSIHFYNAKDVIEGAVSMLGDEADEVLQGPRARLGPPWAKDHRVRARSNNRGWLNPLLQRGALIVNEAGPFVFALQPGNYQIQAGAASACAV